MQKIILPFFILFYLLILPPDTNAQIKPSADSGFKHNLFLIAGMNFNKQNITLNNFSARFIYDLNDYHKNIYKPGYLIGIRYEKKYKEHQKIATTLSVQKVVTGRNYLDNITLKPFIKNYSNFKGDDQFVIMSLSSYFKQEFVFGNKDQYTMNLLFGPSLNIRLSEQTPDNLFNHNYKHTYFSGDGGIEFNNPSFYTLFVHYKLGLNSFTKSPIKTYVNSVEIGTIIKTSDLF